MGPGRSLLLDRREVLRSREHHESRRTCAALGRQAVSRFRPRARRAARIRRPAVVFMRARKPCSLARWRFLGWYVCFVKAVLRSSRSDLGDGRSVFPLEARKRARCPAGHMARRRPADDRSAPEWVSNVRDMTSRARVGYSTAPLAGLRWQPSGASGTASVGLRTDTPREYVRIALRRDLGRCYPLRALGAGDVRGRRQQPRGGVQAAVVRPRRMDVDRTLHRHAPRPGPWPPLFIDRQPRT